jgi:hypothetical protein
MANPAPSNIRIKPPAALATLVLAAILAIPAIATFSTDHLARSSWEKRPLAEFPSLSDRRKKSYFEELENFINDHIGLALEFNQLYRKLKYYVFRDSPVANVVAGKNGFMFLGSHDANNPHRIFDTMCREQTPVAVQQMIRRGVGSIAVGIFALNMRPSFGILPSKPVVYPQQLPRQLPQRYRDSCLAYSQRPNLPTTLARDWPAYIHYPLQNFIELRDQPYFYPPQNFHAQGYSAHEFARSFLATMGIELDSRFDSAREQQLVMADLELAGFTQEINIWRYPYAEYGVIKHEGQPELVRRFYPRVEDFAHFKTAHPASNRVVLLLTNSFGEFMAPHLAPGFKDLYYININELAPENTQPLLTALFAQGGITDFVYLVHDEGLMNGFKLDQLTLGLRGILEESPSSPAFSRE